MDLLLLSGNGKQGKDWLRKVDESLAPQFNQTYRHDYAHWDNDEPEINLDLEVERLSSLVQNLPPYMVFAKSAGTILASKAASMGVLKPSASLFVGVPLVMIHDHNLPVKKWLDETDFPIIILQHTYDPYGSFKDVGQYIKLLDRRNISIHELPGNTHDYLELQTFQDFTKSLRQMKKV